MIPLLIDRLVPGLKEGRQSLLTLPVGPHIFLEYLLESLNSSANGELFILASERHNRCDLDEIKSITSSQLKLLQPEELTDALHEYEPLDQLLIMDPTCWPVKGFDLTEILGEIGEYRGATHVIALGADEEHARERIEVNTNGEVKRVQRYYNAVNWPEVANHAIFLSVLPVRALDGICFTSLVELRSELSARGVFSRDIPLAVQVEDLTREQGLLALNECVLTQNDGPEAVRPATMNDGQLVVGKNCLIHSTARLIGEVVLQDGVTIDENVTIVGPTVVGAQSIIRYGATIIQSVLAAKTVVESKVIAQHRLLRGTCSKPIMAATSNNGSMPKEIKLTSTQLSEDRSLTRAVQTLKNGRQIHLAAKRVMDVTLSLLGLLVLLPLLVVVAILIKLSSPGPVFFIHRREGKDGVEFPCLKFRTMVTDAHNQQRELYHQSEVDGPQFKVRHDPRVTRIGRWLRATNIDELPQLINVLLGHMSLVGPRPSPFRENQICLPWRKARL